MKKRFVILIGSNSVTMHVVELRRQGRSALWQTRVDCAVAPTLYDGFDPTAILEAIGKGLSDNGTSHADTTLVIPSRWCYDHPVDLPRKRLVRSAATYALEEFLPAPIDTVTCDFRRIDDTHVLGVAVPSAPMAHVLSGLAELGLSVDVITPMDRDGEALGDESTDSELDDDDEERIDQLLDEVCTCRRLINLCRGALAGSSRRNTVGRNLEKTLAVAAVFMLCLLTWLSAQLGTYDDALKSTHGEMAEVYTSVFPESALPPNPAMRLASERLRLERQVGADVGADEDALDQRDRLASLVALRELAGSLSSDIRLRLQDVTIDDRRFVLRGETRDHRDAERIAEAVGSIDGWDVEPPRTSRLDEGGVQFSLRASRRTQGAEGKTLADGR